jgi:hypothetical protein
MYGSSVHSRCKEADEDVLAGFPAQRRKNGNTNKAIFRFRICELQVGMVDARGKDGAAGTEDKRAEIEDRRCDEIIPGTETKVTVHPKEEREQDDCNIVCCFKKLVAVVPEHFMSDNE